MLWLHGDNVTRFSVGSDTDCLYVQIIVLLIFEV